MENPNIPELLLEVTMIEDLIESSGAADQNSRQLGIATGFRELAAHPEKYGVKNEDFRHWATALETELGRNTDLANLSVGIGNNILNNNTQLTNAQRQVFLATGAL